MLQKYYAYIFVDYQSWFEKRRTGYPVLREDPGIPVENNFPEPRSVSYLPSVTQLQQTSETAVSRMVADNSAIKVWWNQ